VMLPQPPAVGIAPGKAAQQPLAWLLADIMTSCPLWTPPVISFDP
jgi:hypothetical protein